MITALLLLSIAIAFVAFVVLDASKGVGRKRDRAGQFPQTARSFPGVSRSTILDQIAAFSVSPSVQISQDLRAHIRRLIPCQTGSKDG